MAIIGGIIFLAVALWLTRKIYIVLRYNETTPYWTKESIKLPRGRSWLVGIILLPFNVFLYLMAVLAIFKVDLIAPLFQAIK